MRRHRVRYTPVIAAAFRNLPMRQASPTVDAVLTTFEEAPQYQHRLTDEEEADLARHADLVNYNPNPQD